MDAVDSSSAGRVCLRGDHRRQRRRTAQVARKLCIRLHAVAFSKSQKGGGKAARPEAEVDFDALFDAAPEIYLVLDASFNMVAANQARLAATMTTREQVIGRNLFEVFPDNPDDPAADGVRNLRSSLERVLQTKTPDAMAVQKYDIPRAEAQGGGFETRLLEPAQQSRLGRRRRSQIHHPPRRGCDRLHPAEAAGSGAAIARRPHRK